jgi:hypothetical protein
VQVFWKSPRHVFVYQEDLVVQIRGEAHSMEALRAQETGLQLARAQFRGTVFGAMLVIEEGAEAPTGEIAKAQRELVRTFASDERVRIALVLEGGGSLVSLKRTLARGLFTGKRRTICGTVREGARWLANEFGDRAREDQIASLVEKLREWK